MTTRPASDHPTPSTAGVRVAIDVGPLYGHRTGVGVAVAGTITALRARDDVAVDPYLVSSRTEPNPGDRKLPLPGIVASHLWSRWPHPSADRWLRGADVVHGTNYVAPPSSLPTVVSVYDCWFLRHPERATPLVRRAGAILRRAIARGAWVHASSAATAAQAAELLATDRIVTVHLGPPAPPPPDPARPALGERLGGRPFVVAIGTEERRKDLPLLISAFEQLAPHQPDLALVIAGAPADQSAEIEAAVAASPARERIVRPGPVDEPTKHWLLRHAAVLAYPSLDEGFGFPLLEAQLAGTPVVARGVGSIPEIAGDGAALVTERSSDELASALARVLTDDDRRAALVSAGRANVERFRWADTAEGLVALYHTAIETSR